MCRYGMHLTDKDHPCRRDVTVKDWSKVPLQMLPAKVSTTTCVFAELENDLIDSAGKPLHSLYCIQGLLLCTLSVPELCHLQLVCRPQRW